MQRLRDICAPALHFFTWTLRALFPLRSCVRGRGSRAASMRKTCCTLPKLRFGGSLAGACR